MIRVLHISRNYHPHAGGTEQFIASLARHTRPFGIESSVLCTDRHPAGEAPAPEIPVLRVRTWGPERLQVTRRVTPEVRAALQAADVLHFHDLRFGLDLPRRARVSRRVPRVASTHGLIFHTTEHASIKRVAWRAVYLPALRRCSVVIADSAHDYDPIASLPRRARCWLPRAVARSCCSPRIARSSAPRSCWSTSPWRGNRVRCWTLAQAQARSRSH